MASANVVISNANDSTPAIGSVFEGLSFFLTQRLPFRSRFVRSVETNGGRVVRIENQADYVVADHVRKDSPAGSISYTFIESAIRDGRLPEANDHAAGPPRGVSREPGSAVPGKNTRTAFTTEDDRVLWQWVENCVRKGGAMVKGNEIYKQLERVNPRHTFQAWRDRYIKKLMDKPPPAGVELTVSANAPPTPPIGLDEPPQIVEQPVEEPVEEPIEEPVEETVEEAVEDSRDVDDDAAPQAEESEPEPTHERTEPSPDPLAEFAFTEEDYLLLWSCGGDIIRIHPTQDADAWELWASQHPPQSAQSWRRYWHETILPEYVRLSAPDGDGALGAGVTQQEGAAPAFQIAPGSSASRKRGREDETSHSPAPSNHKKRRSSPQLDLQDDVLQGRQLAPPQQAHPKVSPPLPTQTIELLSNDGGSDEEREASPAVQPKVEEAEGLSRPSPEISLSHRTTTSQDAIGATSQGDPLTKENLASQQAQHRAQLLRGTDLPEDDVEEDAEQQAAYVRVLQDLTGPTAPVEFDFDQFLASSPKEIDDAINAALAWPESPDKSRAAAPPPGLFRELDAAITLPQPLGESDWAINWPDSPKHLLQAESESQNLGLETQVVYPELPRHISDQGDQPLPSGRLDVEAEVVYPLLPTLLGAPQIARQAESDASASLDPVGLGEEDDGPELESSYVLVENRLDAKSSPENLSEDEPDLSIPEPDGGWSDFAPVNLASSQQEGIVASQEAVEATWSPRMAELEDVVAANEQDGRSEASSNSSPIPSSPPVEERDANHAPQQRIIVETQDILNAETQQPDFDMPLPSDSESDTGEAKVQVGTPNRAWSKFEDSRLLHGMRIGLNGRAIKKTYQLERSDSAIRNRRSLLSKHLHGGANPTAEKEYESEDSEEDQSRDDEFEEDESEGSELPTDPLELPVPPQENISTSGPGILPESQRLPDEDFDSYLNKMVVFGHPEIAVIEALKRTSMRPDLADLVLLEAKAGRGLPLDVRGIWSMEEDQTLESGDARGLRKLEEKHTWEECEQRMLFLQELRD